MTIKNKTNKILATLIITLIIFITINSVTAAEQNDTTIQNTVDDNTISNTENIDRIDDTIIEDEKSVETKSITKNINETKKESSTTTEKEDPDIRLSNSEIHPGKDKTFFALLPYDSTGTVTFKIGKTKISPKLAVEDGQVMYTYTIPSTYNSEKYILYLVYSGDSNYKSKTVNATLTLTPEGGKVNATMTMTNYTTKYLSNKTVKVKLNTTATGSVVFKMNGKKIGTAKITNGVASVNYTANLLAGVHELTATYNGNFMYEPTTVNSSFTVIKLKSYLTLKDISIKAGSTTAFKATIIDELGRYVPNMKVGFKLNNNTIGSNKTNSKGVVTLYYKFPSIASKQTYNLTVIGISKNTVAGSRNQSVITLKQLKTKVLVPNISTIPSKSVVITATVLDEFNNYVTKGYMTFKKGSTKIKTVAVSNGFATYQYVTNYQTSSSTYLYAEYVGNWKYANSTGKGTFKITQLKTTTSLGAIEAKPNTLITLNAKVMDQNQNLATDGRVRFSIGDKVVGTMNVTNGVARLKYNLKSYDSGSYRITAEYLGSKIYKTSSNTNTLTINKYATAIKGNAILGVVGNSTTISVNVIDDEKYNVNNGVVKFYVDSEYIGSANVSNGIASIDYIIPSKFDGKILKYYATYEKNGIYDSSSYSDTLSVSHQKIVYVSPNGNDNNLGDKNHPFKTIGYAISHITLFGTIELSEGTFSASGIKINTSTTIIGKGKDKTVITGIKSGSPIFTTTKRNVVLNIEGLTFKNGVSNNEFSAGAIVSSGKVNVANSRFVNNTGKGAYSGGAIYSNGILNLTNCEFINNIASDVNSQGGAIRVYSNTTYITKCIFDSNKVTGTNSTGGSVIYSDLSDVIINQTTFKNNVASGKYVTGGVIRTIEGIVVIDNSTFNNNRIKATDYGMGGIVGSLSSGISILRTQMNSNTIEATNSAGGSVIYIETAALDIKNSKMNSNKIVAKYCYGGAIYGYLASITLTEDITNNNILTANNNGFGGAVYVYGGNLNITSTKFTSNVIKAKEMALAGAIYSSSTIVISKSEFANNNVNGSNLGGGTIANMGDLTITQTNFINNSALGAGDAITAVDSSKNMIENNYWGSSSPNWSKLLFTVAQPSSYSKSKFNN